MKKNILVMCLFIGLNLCAEVLFWEVPNDEQAEFTTAFQTHCSIIDEKFTQSQNRSAVVVGNYHASPSDYKWHYLVRLYDLPLNELTKQGQLTHVSEFDYEGNQYVASYHVYKAAPCRKMSQKSIWIRKDSN
ncbi:hypothetical protein [Candidatus Marinarcus aquaticus]|uniref:Lipoprotein n=1 Tax=Candidatus Marinarcus aquaticus TaxID=2044504 RepID=A0A4Q0XSM4_9BACT|nr:hypothetical protein [Candidatus Marinarcus aquaticus]RXJ60003.1 hypothetical protein CRV04_03030 [Candidatus Marinarcus aquaticus]